MLFGFGPCGFEGGGGTLDVAVREVDVGPDAVVAALPAQGRDGGQSGGEVAADSGGVGQAAAAARGESAVGVGDPAHAVEGFVGAGEVFVGLGLVVQGEVGEFPGQQAGVQDGGEALGGALAVLVPAAGDGVEELGQGVGRGVRARLRRGTGGGGRG